MDVAIVINYDVENFGAINKIVPQSQCLEIVCELIRKPGKLGVAVYM